MNKDKSILITGSSSGIGRATAIALDQAGYKVFAGVRNHEDAKILKKNLSQHSHPVLIDVTSDESVNHALEEIYSVVKNHGLFGLVNNAGVGDFGPVETLDLNRLRNTYEINIFGVLRVTQASLALLRTARGRIVNISSVGGVFTPPFAFPLCSSKYVIESMSHALQEELAPWGIDVITINPSFITTPSSHKMMEIVNERVLHFTERQKSLYKDRFLKVLSCFAENEANLGKPPEVVSQIIVKAFQAKNPQAHYPAGPRAKLLMLMAKFLSQKTLLKLFDK